MNKSENIFEEKNGNVSKMYQNVSKIVMGVNSV